MTRPLPLLFLLFLLFSSCREEWSEPVSEDDTPRLELAGKVQTVYNENTSQLSFSPSPCRFGIFSDDMSDYLFVTLSALPLRQGEKITAHSLEWSTENDIIVETDLEFVVRKSEDKALWLWNGRKQILLVLKELN